MIFIDCDCNCSWKATKKSTNSRTQLSLNQQFSDYLKLFFGSPEKEDQTIENYKFQNETINAIKRKQRFNTEHHKYILGLLKCHFIFKL